MHGDRNTGLGDNAGEGGDLLLVRMHPARRHQPHHMRGAAGRLQLADEILHRRQARDVILRERLVDARQILHDDAAGAEIGVADFGIAHLPVGQPDIMLAGFELRMRPAPHQLVPHRRLRPFDGVVVAVIPLAPAVEDAQHQRARAGIHGSLCLEMRRVPDVYANPAAPG